MFDVINKSKYLLLINIIVGTYTDTYYFNSVGTMPNEDSAIA